MDTSAFDGKISEIEAQVKPERDRAEIACKDFIAAAGRFASTWSAKQIEDHVTRLPEITTKLGEKLSALKAGMTKLQSEMPNHAEKHINRDPYWLHRGAIPYEDDYRAGPYTRRGNRPPEELDKAVRGLLGYAGDLLLEYGYIPEDRGNDWLKQGQSMRYAYGYEWSAELFEALRHYEEIFKGLTVLSRQRYAIQQEKERAIAKDLWNKA